MGLDYDFDITEEFKKAVVIMTNAVSKISTRMPADYIKLACNDAIDRWCIFHEGSYGITNKKAS